MTTSRLRRPTSVSTTQTFSPSRANAAPTLAVVVVLPTPPLPDVTRMALAFTLWSLLQEPAPGTAGAPPSASQGIGSRGTITSATGRSRGGREPVTMAPPGRSWVHSGAPGQRYVSRGTGRTGRHTARPARARTRNPRRLGPGQAGVLEQESLGAGALEHDRDLGARTLAGEPHDRAGAELGMLHALASPERHQVVLGTRRASRRLHRHWRPPDVAGELRR